MARRGTSQEAPGRFAHPEDACPFPRPFPRDFRECAAYRPIYFVGLTTGYEPMPPVWTCANLVPSPAPGEPGRFYPRCRLGDAPARRRWAEGEHAKRLEVLRELSLELTRTTAPSATELVSAKGAQLQTRSGSAQYEAATRRLRAVCDAWLQRFDVFLERHGDRLHAVGFPPEAVRTLCVDLLRKWVEQPDAVAPEISDDALRLFPEDVRVLLRPGDESGAPRASARQR